MPVFSGKLASNTEKASRPPAEAPMPTIGNERSGDEPLREEASPVVVDANVLRLRTEDFFTEDDSNGSRIKDQNEEERPEPRMRIKH